MWLKPTRTKRRNFGLYQIPKGPENILVKYSVIIGKFSISASIVDGRYPKRHATLIFRLLK